MDILQFRGRILSCQITPCEQSGGEMVKPITTEDKCNCVYLLFLLDIYEGLDPVWHLKTPLLPGARLFTPSFYT
jgi:hypothetical protein